MRDGASRSDRSALQRMFVVARLPVPLALLVASLVLGVLTALALYLGLGDASTLTLLCLAFAMSGLLALGVA